MNNNSATSRSIRALDDYIEGRLAIAKRDAETTYEEYPKMSSQEIEEGVKKERELNTKIINDMFSLSKSDFYKKYSTDKKNPFYISPLEYAELTEKSDLQSELRRVEREASEALKRRLELKQKASTMSKLDYVKEYLNEEKELIKKDISSGKGVIFNEKDYTKNPKFILEQLNGTEIVNRERTKLGIVGASAAAALASSFFLPATTLGFGIVGGIAGIGAIALLSFLGAMPKNKKICGIAQEFRDSVEAYGETHPEFKDVADMINKKYPNVFPNSSKER